MDIYRFNIELAGSGILYESYFLYEHPDKSTLGITLLKMVKNHEFQNDEIKDT